MSNFTVAPPEHVALVESTGLLRLVNAIFLSQTFDIRKEAMYTIINVGHHGPDHLAPLIDHGLAKGACYMDACGGHARPNHGPIPMACRRGRAAAVPGPGDGRGWPSAGRDHPAHHSQGLPSSVFRVRPIPCFPHVPMAGGARVINRARS